MINPHFRLFIVLLITFLGITKLCLQQNIFTISLQEQRQLLTSDAIRVKVPWSGVNWRVDVASSAKVKELVHRIWQSLWIFDTGVFQNTPKDCYRKGLLFNGIILQSGDETLITDPSIGIQQGSENIINVSDVKCSTIDDYISAIKVGYFDGASGIAGNMLPELQFEINTKRCASGFHVEKVEKAQLSKGIRFIIRIFGDESEGTTIYVKVDGRHERAIGAHDDPNEYINDAEIIDILQRLV